MHMSFIEKLAAHFLPGLREQSAWLWSSLDGARFNTSRAMRQPHLGDAGEQRWATGAQAAARTMAQRLLEGAQQLQGKIGVRPHLRTERQAWRQGMHRLLRKELLRGAQRDTMRHDQVLST